MKTIGFIMAVLALCVARTSAENLAAKSAQEKLRVGTYDSRVIAMAYYFSETYNAAEGKMTEACNKEMEKARASGDKKQVADVETKYKDLIQTQIRRHKQVFSTAPIDDLLLLIHDDLPEIAKAAGVGPIVSKWDKAGLEPYQGAELVDVTMPMAKALHPTDEQLKAALELQKQAPIPLEQAEKMDWTKE